MISIKKILSSNINSKNFTYFTDLCKSYGLTDGVVRNRIARGWTIEQAFGIVFRKSESPGRDKKVEVDGIKYKSIQDACKALKVNKENVYQRLRKKNYTIEQAFELEVAPKKEAHNSIKFTVGKRNFTSRTEACEFYGIKMKTVATRLSRGWSLDEALGVKKRLISKDKIYDSSGNKKKGFIYIVENKKNKKIYIGLTIGTIKERFNSHIYNASKNSHKDSLGYAIWNYGSDMFAYKELKKATIDQLGAFETKYINQYNSLYPKGYNMVMGGSGIGGGSRLNMPLMVDSKKYFSISDAARVYKIKIGTVRGRIKSGWSIEDALKTKVREIKKIMIDNKEYESINHAARVYKIKISTARGRIKSGWSIEDALKTKIK